VVHAEDGLPERDPVHLWRDVALMRQNARRLHARQPLDYHALAGNFVMTAGPEGYLVYAHLQTGSVAVAVGQPVAVGQVLGRVGHSGNSTAPHLHFQLMDDPDPWQGQGVLCAFRAYDVYEAGEWRRVERGIPTASDRIRA
jgi:murein DD-endopeptidase MepM/ murein hydrolase activator NlpD